MSLAAVSALEECSPNFPTSGHTWKKRIVAQAGRKSKAFVAAKGDCFEG